MGLGNVFGKAQAVSQSRDQQVARLAQMAAMGEALRRQRKEAKKASRISPEGVIGGMIAGGLTGGLGGALAGGFGAAQATRGQGKSGFGEGLLTGAFTGFTGAGKSPIAGIQKAKEAFSAKPKTLKGKYTTKEVQNAQGETVIAHVPTAEGEAEGFEPIFTDIKPGAKKTQEIMTRDDYIGKGFVVANTRQADKLANRTVVAADTGEVMLKLQPLPATQAKAISDIDESIAIQQDALADMERFGLVPDPITGRIPLVGDDINVFVKDPEWQAWQAKVDRAFQKYRKITTGAQASDKEIARLVPLMPSSKDRDPEVYTRKAIQVIEEMQRSKGIILNTFQDAGFDVGNLGSSADPLGIL
jgi:hypothetical protein